MSPGTHTPRPAVKKEPMPLRRNRNDTRNVVSENTRMRMTSRLPQVMWYWSKKCTRMFPRIANTTKLYRTVRRTYESSDCAARYELWNRKGACSIALYRSCRYVKPPWFGTVPTRLRPIA